MTARHLYAAKRARRLSGFCNPSWSLATPEGRASHDRCTLLDCSCEHHNQETPVTITAPETDRQGFHDAIPETTYHADRDSLSVSGAKVLLKAPALFKWQQDHPVHKDVFDIGSAAHKLVLGVGAKIRVVEADSWRTKDAKAEKDAAHAAGEIPLLAADYQRVQDMADALSSHRLAMQLLSDGKPEVSAYAVDEATGVMRRGRFDWLRDDLIVDFKTAASADPGAFARAAASFGYHQQHAWYLDLARDLGHQTQGFVFLVQEKEAPYLVSVVELVPDAVEVGRDLNRQALERFRDCREAGLWPGYARDDQIIPIDIPRWAYYQQETTA